MKKITLLIAFIAILSSAQATPGLLGSGSELDPYLITNLIDLKKGIVLTSCPSKDLAIDKATHEPRYGLMYDVISKRYSGQYNLFNERYTYNWLDKEDSKSIIHSIYATEDVLLSNVKQKLTFDPDDAALKYVETEDDNVIVMVTEKEKVKAEAARLDQDLGP